MDNSWGKWFAKGTYSLVSKMFYAAQTQEIDKLTQDEIYHKAQAKALIEAKDVITDVICPALNKFINTVSEVLKILQYFRSTIESIHNKSKQQQLNPQDNDRVEILFSIVKSHAKRIIDGSISMIAYQRTCLATFECLESYKVDSYSLETQIYEETKVPQQKPLIQDCCNIFANFQSLCQKN